MRFLPILIPVFMLMPFVIWALIEVFVIKGSAMVLLTGHLTSFIVGGILTLFVCGALVWWMGENIKRTSRH
ncbi:MAG: hypothetical protein KDE22_12610 [Rhodobacterales bacterium]|nr:hypothetical protein [Rhodobacterales bacterium]